MKRVRVFLLMICTFSGHIVPMQEPNLTAAKVFSISDVKVRAIAFISNFFCCVATLSNDFSSLISVYDIPSKKIKLTIYCPGQITSISPCDNLTKIAVALQSRILVFNVDTGQLIREYKAHTERVNSVSAHAAFSDVIISGSQDRTIKIWDLKSPVASKIENAHAESVTCVRISGNPHYFVSTSDDKNTKIWDWNGLRSLIGIKHHSAPLSIEYNQDSDRFMTCSNQVSRYNAENAALMSTINRDGQLEPTRGSRIGVSNSSIPLCVSIGHDDQELMALGRDDGRIVLCYPERSNESAQVLSPFSSAISGLAFSPNGTYLVAGSQVDQKLQVYELPPQKAISEPKTVRKGSIKGCFGLE
jgi:WD40 repeat protein